MKNNLRKLNLLIKKKVINPDDFYCIDVWENEIKLQGKFKSELACYFNQMGFAASLDRKGYVNLNRGNINIVLEN